MRENMRKESFITFYFFWSVSIVLIALLIPLALSLAQFPWRLTNTVDESREILNVPSIPDSVLYNEVTWLCAHNAMSNRDDGWMLPNQDWNIPRQLEMGIHAQMWDVWEKDEELVLRHGNRHIALPGVIKFTDALEFVRDYMTEHMEAVITLFLESYVDNEKVRQVISDMGLFSLLHIQSPEDEWPTLGEMRRTGKRLVIFTDRPGEKDEWPMAVWDYCVETPWETESMDTIRNSYGRGTPENPLLIVNHFLSTPFASVDSAILMNTSHSIRKRYQDIQKSMHRMPQFWVLDFVDVGEGLETIREINRERRVIQE